MRLASKLAVATVGAVVMYIPTFGLPDLFGACLSTVGVASAAPSPTCAGDLRECLRLSAKEGLYGVRYVTADDVSRCMEAFNACTQGTLRGTPNPPKSTSASGGQSTIVPQRFKISYPNQPDYVQDCQVSGTNVSCTYSWDSQMPYGTFTGKGEVSGVLSGSTITGTQNHRQVAHSSECDLEAQVSGPVSYAFRADGTLTMRVGPLQQQFGPCGNAPAGSSTVPVSEGTATWSAIG